MIPLRPISKCHKMSQTPYIFTQLTAHLPKDAFDRLVKRHNGNAGVKSYSCWNHLLVMAWAQLTSRQSLRDIEVSLRAHSDKLYRMGIGRGVSRNNIAYANAKREVALYRNFAQEMMARCASLSMKDKTLRFIGDTFKVNGFFAVDSSSVVFDLRMFPWSVPQEGHGGVKLHTMYDLLRGVPRMCLITGHEERDQTFMEYYPYEKGCFYMFDRMYFKTKGLSDVDSCGAYFVTRLKRGVLYIAEETFPVNGVHTLSDQSVRLTGRWAGKGFAGRLRLVRHYSPEKNEVLCFVTNNFEVDAATIALLYKYRWQIEMFFKWIKQHLRITAFYGTSANAVMIQIYTALISFCMLALAADSLRYEGSLYEFSNIMSVSLTEREYMADLLARFDKPLETGGKYYEPWLFDFDKMSLL